ncbi:MAG: disulfide bond formation protein DsbA [Halobacteriovoraceae bacterium]|nr:disulfide bond formation protein DsbA [Halobacteriovoraceae bacterium]
MIGSFFLGNYIYEQQIKAKNAFLAQENAELFIRDYSPRTGAENPKVYLVEFLDPECESCRAFHPYTKQILEHYKEQLQLVIRYAPFHHNSKFAIKILEAARKQNKYWEVLDTLFRFQPQWGNHHNPQPELIWEFLTYAKVDVEQIRKDYQNPKFDEIIKQDSEDGRSLNIRGTPTFFVNGELLQEFSPEGLKNLIEKHLNK